MKTIDAKSIDAKTIDAVISAILAIDESAEVEKIVRRVRELLQKTLRRRGLVLGVSGGVDSAVCAALAVKAVGADRVLALLMPESDSSPESLTQGRLVADSLGIPYVVEDISPTLAAIGCYRWRDDAIRSVFPQYGHDWKNKIVIAGGGEDTFHHFNLVVADPDGRMQEQRLGIKEYLQIVAATNFKQRIRKTLEFFHAERLNFAVVGTPNRLEYDQGFFVKGGDGAADLKPIAHLYKSQVYMLARHLGLPEVVCNAAPTTDTYSLTQGQDEFYYALPYKEMDVALWHRNHGRSVEELGAVLNIDAERARFIYRDIDTKRKTTAPLHWPALLLEKVEGPLPPPSL